MRKITEIIIHCTATPPGRQFTVEQIRRMHVEQNGWNDIGYHYVIYHDGSVHEGRNIETPGAHCKGHNSNSIGIAYVGGVMSDCVTPADTRTQEQKSSLERLISQLLEKFPEAKVYSHRDFARKACPSFDATAEYRRLGKGLTAILPVLLALIFSSCRCQSLTSRSESETTSVSRLNRLVTADDSTSLKMTIRVDSIMLLTFIPDDSVKKIVDIRNATIEITKEQNRAITTSTQLSDTITRNTTKSTDEKYEPMKSPPFNQLIYIAVAILITILLYIFSKKIKECAGILPI